MKAFSQKKFDKMLDLIFKSCYNNSVDKERWKRL